MITLRFVLVAAVGLVAGISLGAAPAPPAVGKPVSLHFQAFDGSEVDLHSLRGKLVLVHFWASTSDACMREAEHVTQIEHRYAGKGLVVIGIDLDRKSEDMEKAAKKYRFDWPEYFDGHEMKGHVAVAWGVRSVPMEFLISTKSRVLWEGAPDKLDAAIDEALAGDTPTLVDAKTTATAGPALDRAQKLVDEHKPSEAMTVMDSIPPEARDDPDLRKRYEDLEAQIEPAAGAMVDNASAEIDQENFAKAAGTLIRVKGALTSTATGKRAASMLAEMKQNPDAKTQIAQAETQQESETALVNADVLADQKQDLSAYDAYKKVASDYPGTPAATKATAAMAKYDADPAFAKIKSNEQTAATDEKAEKVLNLGKNYAAAGRNDLARDKFNEVIENYPDSAEAAEAKSELAKLGN